MAAKEPTQKAKLQLKALELALTTDVKDDYYLQPKLQKCLNMDDLAAEVAALSTRQEDPEDIARTGRDLMRRMMWYLSAGYSISTPLGYFRPTAQGVFMESELNEAIDRDRLTLGVKYSMSEDMRQALDDADIDVEIQKAASGPQLYAVVSAQDAEHPDAVTRGEGVPVSGGQVCIIKAKNGAVKARTSASPSPAWMATRTPRTSSRPRNCIPTRLHELVSSCPPMPRKAVCGA